MSSLLCRARGVATRFTAKDTVCVVVVVAADYVRVVVVVVADYVSGGELFTHLYQREHFTEEQVRIYIGEIILALEHLHKVRLDVKFKNKTKKSNFK